MLLALSRPTLTVGKVPVPKLEFVFSNQAERLSSATAFLATLYASSLELKPSAGLTIAVEGHAAGNGAYGSTACAVDIRAAMISGTSWAIGKTMIQHKPLGLKIMRVRRKEKGFMDEEKKKIKKGITGFIDYYCTCILATRQTPTPTIHGADRGQRRIKCANRSSRPIYASAYYWYTCSDV